MVTLTAGCHVLLSCYRSPGKQRMRPTDLEGTILVEDSFGGTEAQNNKVRDNTKCWQGYGKEELSQYGVIMNNREDTV